MKKKKSWNPSNFLYGELSEQTNNFIANSSGKAEKKDMCKAQFWRKGVLILKIWRNGLIYAFCCTNLLTGRLDIF